MAEDPPLDAASPASSPRSAVPIALGEMAAERPLTITVRGDCMAPWLTDGERVAVERRRIYWPGDVVAFQDLRGRRVLHRVIGWRPSRKGLRILTQADVAPRADSSVPHRRVIGKARVSVPWSQRWRAIGRFCVLCWERIRTL